MRVESVKAPEVSHLDREWTWSGLRTGSITLGRSLAAVYTFGSLCMNLIFKCENRGSKDHLLPWDSTAT